MKLFTATEIIDNFKQELEVCHFKIFRLCGNSKTLKLCDAQPQDIFYCKIPTSKHLQQ